MSREDPQYESYRAPHGHGDAEDGTSEEPVELLEIPWELRDDDGGSVVSGFAADIPVDGAGLLAPVDDAGSVGGWRVVVVHGHAQTASTSAVETVEVRRRRYADRDEALADAHREASEFRPLRPWRVQRREVYRTADGFYTVLYGQVSTFGFTTRVLEQVEILES